jgi:hypothetical protein
MKRVQIQHSTKTNPILQTSLPLHLYANDTTNKSLNREWNISIRCNETRDFSISHVLLIRLYALLARCALGKREGNNKT